MNEDYELILFSNDAMVKPQKQPVSFKLNFDLSFIFVVEMESEGC